MLLKGKKIITYLLYLGKKKYEKSPIEFEDIKVFRINNMSNSWFGVFNEEIRWVDQW